MGRFKKKRCSIFAKRKDTNESWTAWSETDDYNRAKEHAAYAEKVGYSAKIVVNEEKHTEEK